MNQLCFIAVIYNPLIFALAIDLWRLKICFFLVAALITKWQVVAVALRVLVYPLPAAVFGSQSIESCFNDCSALCTVARQEKSKSENSF